MGNNTSKTDIGDNDKKIEAIIRTVAAKHSIALGPNDPILILHTVNNLLLEEFANRQEELITQFRENLETAADLWSKNTEAKAAEILRNVKDNSSRLIHDQIENQFDGISLVISEKCDNFFAAQQKKTMLNLKFLYRQLTMMKLLTYINCSVSTIGIIIFLCHLI